CLSGGAVDGSFGKEDERRGDGQGWSECRCGKQQGREGGTDEAQTNFNQRLHADLAPHDAQERATLVDGNYSCDRQHRSKVVRGASEYDGERAANALLDQHLVATSGVNNERRRG